MIRIFFLLIVAAVNIAIANEEKDLSPTLRFIKIIQSRQANFEEFQKRIFKEELCPGIDYNCVLSALKTKAIQTSGDIDNGISLLAYMAQKKFKKGDCKEICRMNLYAEYSTALVDLLKLFNRNKIFVSLLPADHPETKYLVVNEELRFFSQFEKLYQKLIQHHKKIDPSKIFVPELAKRMEGLKSEIELLRPAILLKGSFLSSLTENDETLKQVMNSEINSEREKMERKELITLFRSEIKN